MHFFIRSFILSLFLIGATTSWGQGIEFRKGRWAKILEMASQEDKPIFVDAYTTWCGPCKWMAANLFPTQVAGDFYNENYISVQIDMEKGEGIDFAAKYEVNAYPTLLFFNPQGELVHRAVGTPQEPETLVDYGRNALNPETQIYTLIKRYEAGEREPGFIKNYIGALQAASMDAGEVTKTYLLSLPKEQWVEPDNWAIIKSSELAFRDPIVAYVLEHQEDFEAVHFEEVETFIYNALASELIMSLRSDDRIRYDRMIKWLQEKDPDMVAEWQARGDFYFYLNQDEKDQDPEEKHRLAKAYLETFASNPNELNTLAWEYYESVDNTDWLKDALVWVNKSISMDRGWYNVDTKAALLYKLKEYEEALDAANLAIDLGLQSGEDVSSTEELRDEIRTYTD